MNLNLWLNSQKKHCPFCQNSETIKWGQQNNKQRWFCKDCEKFFIWENIGTRKNQQLKLFRKWVLKRKTIQDLSQETGKATKTLRRIFREFLSNPPFLTIQPNKNCRLIIDGTYFKDGFCLLVYDDYLNQKIIYQQVVVRENYLVYKQNLKHLKNKDIQLVSLTSDGQKGLIKAVKEVFPECIHQRCIIHIQRMSLIYLTRRPRTEAGQVLRMLVIKLHQIETHQQKDFWIKWFKDWCQEFHTFLQEKSQSLSGRRWYTHKLLRRTRSLIKNALPNMFHYLDDNQIPKSTNGLETKFSYLKNDLKIHRGLSKEHRQNFILWYNYFKYFKK